MLYTPGDRLTAVELPLRRSNLPSVRLERTPFLRLPETEGVLQWLLRRL